MTAMVKITASWQTRPMSSGFWSLAEAAVRMAMVFTPDPSSTPAKMMINPVINWGRKRTTLWVQSVKSDQPMRLAAAAIKNNMTPQNAMRLKRAA